MASSQHRCVFVGNIPYDATEEQLIEICREVGPVVSFRLVLDRETGKPKGYGFCEYKDEETALSARRNLQGYAINGRQLRVDFAENDKGADRTREQGRGGPGMAAHVDPQKQVGGPGPVLHGESIHHQPIGLHLAITAATVMTGALGGPQVGMQLNQNGIQSQLASPNDPLTLHLAKMSRNQLNEVMSELKLMATQNKELAHQLLLAKPQLLKAIFQAQIMLGMATPQVLQMPSLRQGPGLPAQSLLLEGQQQVVQLSGLPSLAQKMQLMPKFQEGQIQLHNQFSAPTQPSMHPQIQIPQHVKNQPLQQAALPGQSGITTLPSIHHSVRHQIQVANSSSLNQQIQPPSLENQVQASAPSLGHNMWTNLPNSAIRSLFLPRPPSSDAGLQPGPSTSSGIVQTDSRDANRSGRVPEDAFGINGNNPYTNMPVGLSLKSSKVNDSAESISRPLKMLKTEDGSGTSFSMGALNASKPTGSSPSQAFGAGIVPVNQVPKVEDVQYSDEQIPQSQLPPDVESALLQQVLSLTPEQLNSLPPEQRQQVIQLQKALLQDQMQPS